MITVLVLIAALFLTLILWFFLFPVRILRNPIVYREVLEPPDLYVYSYVLHIHTQFSHDSLGKPEDVEKALEVCGIDYALITDHDNDLIDRLPTSRIVAGKEVKISDGEGNVLGDLLDFGDLKIVAHPFTEKYRWKGKKDPQLFLEIVDLKDEVLKSKVRLLLLLIASLTLYPFLRRKVLHHFSKVVDPEDLVLRYFREGWSGPVVGGLDHHVKLSLSDAKTKVLIPDYILSFSILRNLLLTDRAVSSPGDLIHAIREGKTVVSFSDKVPIVWKEGRRIKVYSPYENTLTLLVSEGGCLTEALGPNCVLEVKPGRYIAVGYTYILKVWKILFGIRPLFISYPLEVRDEGETPS